MSVVIAPAMHTEMLENQVIQDHLKTLDSRGFRIIPSQIGELACGDKGVGRLAELETIIETVDSVCQKQNLLNGMNILISAGGTKEMIDPVRCISNLSTGSMGLAIAKKAVSFGANVTLVTSNTTQQDASFHTITVRSSRQMKDQLASQLPKNDVLIMSAAVSDFIVNQNPQKIKRCSGDLNLQLIQNEDVLAALVSMYPDKFYVGFCLEDNDLVEVAKAKMNKKKINMIVANKSTNIGAKLRSGMILDQQDNCIEYTNSSLGNSAALILEAMHHQYSNSFSN